MKEAITALSKDENFILQQLFTHLRIDAPTATRTQKYYRQLRRINTNAHHDPIPIDNTMKAAILIAEQSQQIYNLNGERIGAVHLALNEIVRSTHSLKSIVSVLKTYLTHSKTAQPSLKSDICQLVQQLTFGNNFLTKFRKAIEYFDFVQDVEESSGYRKVFESFSWLMFLNMHQQIHTQTSTQIDYLLISVLYLMVRYAHPFLRIRKMPIQHNHHNNKTLISSILEQLFSIFVIDDPACFKRINAEVDCQFQRLIEIQIIKCRFQYDFLSPALIRNNYKKLDALYQRNKTADSVDFRIFLTNRLETLTPNKHSRVSPHKANNKIQVKPQSFASHRILSFQNEGQTKVSAQMGLKQIKLPANARVSPSYIKTPLLCAQRTSPSLTIELYMAKTIKNNQYRLQLLDNEAEVLSVIESILGELKFKQQILAERVNSTFNYYIALQTKFLNEQQYLQQDLNGIYCSALIHSLLLTAVQKWPQEQQLQSFMRGVLKQISKQIEISGPHLWMVCSFLLKDSQAPPKLRQLMICLELQCVNQYVWREATLDKMREYMNGQAESGQYSDALAARIRKQVRNLIVKLVSTPQFTTFSTLLHQKVYSTLIYITTHAPDIITNRHLHQIVLCACYRTLKAEQPSIRFNDLIQQHQIANHLSNQELRHIIYRVSFCNAEDQLLQANIIQFYNKCYLPFARLLPQLAEEMWSESISLEARIEANQPKPRFSDLGKTHSSNNIQNVHLRVHSQQSEHSQNICKIKKEGQSEQDKHISKHDKQQKDKQKRQTIQEGRDETRQRERGQVTNLHWLQTEKGKGGRWLR